MVSTVDSVTVNSDNRTAWTSWFVDGPVGSVAGPVGEVMTLVPGVKVTGGGETWTGDGFNG